MKMQHAVALGPLACIYDLRMPRSDAEKNFESLVGVAEELLTEDGLDVRFYHVAKRAGVGQGTLYRHFPTRFALLATVYERRIDRYEEFLSEHADDPDLFLTLLRRVASDQQTTGGFLHAIKSETQSEEEAEVVARLQDRTHEVFGRALTTAQQHGNACAELEYEDMHVIIQMLLGAGNASFAQTDREDAMRRALAILERAIK